MLGKSAHVALRLTDGKAPLTIATRLLTVATPKNKIAACVAMLLFISAGPSTKLFAWGEGDGGGHVL
jgi:hypothetical protein